MNKHYLNKLYIDHHLQAGILSKLAASDIPIRFSDLKEEGIENSLFMYHANKLIDRGLITKSDDGFQLTTKGARWINNAGVFHGFQILTPRPLIQFIIYGPDSKILLSRRKGLLKELLNDYMLPGNVYGYGLPLEDNAASIIQDIVGSKPTISLRTTAEIIHHYPDEYTHHVLSTIFEVRLRSSDIKPTTELFELEWFDIADITANNARFKKSLFIPLFLERLPNISSHETFMIAA